MVGWLYTHCWRYKIALVCCVCMCHRVGGRVILLGADLIPCIGLLGSRNHPANFKGVSERYNLFPAMGRDSYVPLMARLLGVCITSTLNSCLNDEWLVLLQLGVMSTDGQDRWADPRAALSLQNDFAGKMTTQGSASSNPGTPIIFLMLGGCTYQEISFAKSVAAQVGRPLIILTSRVITGNRLIDTYMVGSVGLHQ